MTKEEKEKMQQEIDDKRYEREKHLKILKAQNMMLEQAKETVEEHYSKDNNSREGRKVINAIEVAKQDNKAQAKNMFNASEEEVNNSEFNEVSQSYVESYKRRMEKRGITAEQNEAKSNKELDNVSSKVTASQSRKHVDASTSVLKKVQKLGSSGDEISAVQDDSNEDNFVVPTSEGRVVEGLGFEPLEDVDEDPIKSMQKSKPEKKKSTKKKEKVEGRKLEKNVSNNSDDDSIETTAEPTDDDISGKTLKELTGMYEKKEPHVVNGDNEFDPSSLPSYVSFDMIPLPSNGECYPHKKKRCAVKYLTAAEENLIASPNLYRDGKIIDIILKRCILDKDFDVDAMPQGDRDAILLWLRATAYGPEYPIVLMHEGQKYNITVDLSTFKYYNFNLKGDENGLFTYKVENGDEIKFKYLSKNDYAVIQNEMMDSYADSGRVRIMNLAANLKVELVNSNNINEDDVQILSDSLENIEMWAKNVKVDQPLPEEMYANAITCEMIAYTVSVNGNSDREFVNGYVQNMRAGYAKNYRDYVNNNRPGVNFKMTVDIPESRGGGSFDTFLRLDEFIFVNTRQL